jgi:hypothetical protein
VFDWGSGLLRQKHILGPYPTRKALIKARIGNLGLVRYFSAYRSLLHHDEPAFFNRYVLYLYMLKQ